MNLDDLRNQVLPSNRKLNPHLFPETQMKTAAQHNAEVCGDAYVKPEPQPTGDWPIHPAKPPKRIRQSSKPLLNKLETEYLAVLARTEAVRPETIVAQGMRFQLGNGIWYKPDFSCLSKGGSMWAIEVKGPHAFRGGFENLKVAAHLYPWINWQLAWKVKSQWNHQTILP